MLMDDFNSGRPGLMHLGIVGALRHSLMDFRLYCQLHPENGEKSDGDTFGALKLGLQYLFEQKREISEPVMTDILSHVLDISLDSERGGETPVLSDRVGERDIVLTLRERFPRANLDRVSDGLTLFLGFLNTLPREAWETINRSH